MKEAIGELNTTLITFLAVALLSAFFFMIIWPMIKQGLREDESCASAVCDIGYNANGMAYCYNPNDDSKDVFECPYRG